MAIKKRTKAQTKQRERDTNLLVPAAVMREFSEAAVCIDVILPKAEQDALASLCGEDSFDPATFYWAASPRDESESALTLQFFRDRLHCTLQYRRGRDAPFPRATKARLRKVLSLIAGASDKELAYSTFSVPTRISQKTISELPDGAKLVMTGYDFAIEDANGNHNEGFRVRSIDGEMFLTFWSRERTPVDGAAGAFRIARQRSRALLEAKVK